MVFLTENPYNEITEDGEYVCAPNFGPGARYVRMEVFGNRGGGSVQPGLLGPDRQFEPLLAAVTDASQPTAWEVAVGIMGRVAVKISGSSGATLGVAVSEVRK